MRYQKVVREQTETKVEKKWQRELIEKFQEQLISSIPFIFPFSQSHLHSHTPLTSSLLFAVQNYKWCRSTFSTSSALLGISSLSLSTIFFSSFLTMNDENNNPLNLNNLPEDFSATDNGKQAQFEAGSSSSGQISRKKKKDDESGKVYECRFCSLKFCKSQALGGHMNRHRPERETETLNKARMLVFSNENNISTVHGLPAHHLGGFHQPAAVDPNLHFRPAYTVQNVSMRLPTSTHTSNVLQHQHNPPQPYLYPSPPTRPHAAVPYPPQYNYPSANDYFVGHVLETAAPESTNYTCIGAPVGPTGFGSTNSVRESETTGHLASVSNGYYHGNQEDGLGWGSMRGFGGTSHQQLQPTRLDLSLAINRFQDRF